ncbi:hypothetical protein STTU_3675 [Streptomyces sp. Tu6071]|nr:hypothetical protein STTU_3675 [Streptomyces sp. Tu6071]
MADGGHRHPRPPRRARLAVPRPPATSAPRPGTRPLPAGGAGALAALVRVLPTRALPVHPAHRPHPPPGRPRTLAPVGAREAAGALGDVLTACETY